MTEIKFPYATTAPTGSGDCALCSLIAPHPEREEDGAMYWAILEPRNTALICKPHAIECELVTERVLAAQPGAEEAVILHLRGEAHRTAKCPLPHGEVSHRETAAQVRSGAANWEERTRIASTDMSPDEVLVVEHVRNYHDPGQFPLSCVTCRLQRRVDSLRSHGETPGWVVTVTTSDPGVEYTLILPDGRSATLSETMTDYHTLAGVIDRALGD